uniref:Uncharacterized protein n=1 Tax=Poecilia reticulata TaxID=8081 RepID=A0A3P9QFY4_POERE
MKNCSAFPSFLVTIAAASALGAGGAVVAAPVVLGAIGFTSVGIAAGSYAASMMSAAAVANGGGVAAGSAVAVLQSVGKCLKLGLCRASCLTKKINKRDSSELGVFANPYVVFPLQEWLEWGQPPHQLWPVREGCLQDLRPSFFKTHIIHMTI